MKKRFLFTVFVSFFTLMSPLFAINETPAFTLEGAYDYFILSKSLLENNDHSQDYEPQGDTSIGSTGASAFLKADDIPPDASIEKAILVWVVSKNDSDSSAYGDSEITLVTPDSEEHSISATPGNSTTPPSFDFESHYESPYYYYTYRVDVTDIISSYQKGLKGLDGMYTVKDVDDIYDSDKSHVYYSSASMVGGWQLILIYSSERIARKRLYFYYGVEWSSNNMTWPSEPLTVKVSGFELPASATVKISFVTSDGDDYALAPEYLKLKGEKAVEPLTLSDGCNPGNQPFNSKSLTFCSDSKVLSSFSSAFL